MRKKKSDLFTVLTESQRLNPCYKLLAFYLEIQVWLDLSGAEGQQETQRRQQIIKKQQHCSTLLGFMGRVHVLSPVFYNSSPGTSEPTDRQQAQLQRANPGCILLPLQAPALGLVSTIFLPTYLPAVARIHMYKISYSTSLSLVFWGNGKKACSRKHLARAH